MAETRESGYARAMIAADASSAGRRLAALVLLSALAGCAYSEPLPSSPYPEGLYGTWAVGPEYCAAGWWRFSAGRIDTAGETSCEVRNIYTSLTEPPSASYELSCQAEGESEADGEGRLPNWSITLQKDQTLEVNRRDGFGVLRLRRCGGAPNQAVGAK